MIAAPTKINPNQLSFIAPLVRPATAALRECGSRLRYCIPYSFIHLCRGDAVLSGEKLP